MLLIVPYGIETSKVIYRFAAEPLLIVPYGIETYLAPFVGIVRYGLLIVPYGIETTTSDLRKIPTLLLIVPYGIETNVCAHAFGFPGIL